ncbi:MAG: hypothetical protein ACI9X0_000350 [Kiritimatiellia bacterium]|jgi:hypothetical protein
MCLPRFLRAFQGRELKGQDGFFEASLCRAFPQVRFVHLQEVFNVSSAYFENFDWILINRKCVPNVDFGPKVVESFLKRIKGPRIGLVVNNAEEGMLPPAPMLQPFQVIFKREVLKNASGYGLSDDIMKKVHPTMISCPFVSVHRKNRRLSVTRRPRLAQPELKSLADISFVGADTNESRRQLLRGIDKHFENFKGGLYGHKCKHQPLDWDGPKMAQRGVLDYMHMINSAKINLALPGYGGFTYRHLEIWYMGAFMLTSPEIRRVRLPGSVQPEEGVHYIAFESEEDCIEKAAYYLREDAEREKIAIAGRNYFDKLYDFDCHAKEIRTSLCR